VRVRRVFEKNLQTAGGFESVRLNVLLFLCFSSGSEEVVRSKASSLD
jgi:hypothetical protein